MRVSSRPKTTSIYRPKTHKNAGAIVLSSYLTNGSLFDLYVDFDDRTYCLQLDRENAKSLFEELRHALGYAGKSK